MVDQAYLDAILAPTTVSTRRVDIYEADGVSPYYLNAPFIDGVISVDQGRTERRTLELTLDRAKGGDALRHSPDLLWYDKVFKTYRGVITNEGAYESQIGEFVVDNFKEPRFPKTIQLSGRDYTKKLLVDKFARATSFAAGQPIETVIRNIALNSGITKMSLPITGKTLSSDAYFDRGTERMKAITEIANSFNYDVYFDGSGWMVMEPFKDPTTSPLIFSFKTGNGGSLADWDKSTNDTRLYNHIAVTGEASDQIPVVAEAINTQPDSPTSIAKIGDRLYEFVSSFISTTQQAQDVANSFLKIHALEQYDLNLSSLVLPWLDVGNIIEFQDPDPNPGDPTRFLLSSINIPMSLGVMTCNAKRVTVVG